MPGVKPEEDPLLDATGFRDLWRRSGAPQHIILAVSGGSDSVALMGLAAPLRETDGVNLLVATVDHGLRAESADEARRVKQWAEALGLDHATLVWTGKKPAAALQKTARAARYRLLCEEAKRGGFGAIFTGHTMDDQAETVFMRLARGSGPAGLAAMAPARLIAAGAGPAIQLVRPLLTETRARLKKYLTAKGQDFISDPSNLDPAYERVRTRALLGALEAQNLLTRHALWRTAARMARADTDLRAIEEARLKQLNGVFLHWGGASLGTANLKAPDASLVARLIHAVSGAEYAPKLEAAAAAITKINAGKNFVLGGCALKSRDGALVIYRELAALTGRSGIAAAAPVRLAPGVKIVWDGRFIIENPASETIEIRALGNIDVGPGLGPGYGRLFDGPKEALASLPAICVGDRLVAAADLAASQTFRSLAEERFYRKLVRFH